MKFILQLLFILPFTVYGQDILPSLVGEELRLALVDKYKPGLLMNYSKTRDSMYLNVYRDEKGYVECYYTGHSIYLPLNVDPSTFLYDNENPDGITAEHIYPQSKGAKYNNPKSDMHSLFPVIWRANSARSNYPFAEVNDEETDHWYFLTEDSSEIPDNNLDQYSEKLNGGWGTLGKFEPRESVKGDVARAVFYFFTMYKEQAIAEDPEYFQGMKATLLAWHDLDPVDETELRLNKLKAKFQDNKENPFIVDCTLVNRVYGTVQGSEPNCSGYSNIQELETIAYKLYPNPTHGYLIVEGDQPYDLIEIKDLMGRTLASDGSNSNKQIDVSGLEPGNYLLTITKEGFTSVTKRLVKL